MSADVAHHDEEHHHSWVFYASIAVFLGIVTFVELGPLFEWYNIPAVVLILMSVVKFGVVVAFFMHLWDDPPIFTQVFVVPLIGGVLMVMVLMGLFNTWYPSAQEDPFPLTERYWTDFNGECYAWLTSSVSNRTYCASGCTQSSLDAGTCSSAISSKRIADHLGEEVAGPAFSIAGLSDADTKKTLVAEGKALYEVQCSSCHQASGAGVPGAFPPLAGSDYADYKDPVGHARIIVHGLQGEIVVNGQTYNGAMSAFGQLSDLEIAAIATYERNAWGNDDGVVMPDTVKGVR